MKKRFFSCLASSILAAVSVFSSCSVYAQDVEDYVQIADELDFETVDIEGNSISSADLFAEHKITMVNIWASWCGPCVSELPELEELNKEFQEKDAAIVGLLYDGDDEQGLLDAKEIIEMTGVTYTILLPWDTMWEEVYTEVFPTTFFVNSEGEVVGDMIVGAIPELYTEALDELLAE